MLQFAWSVHEPLTKELSNTLDIVQSNWNVNAEVGEVTLAFKRSGEVETFLSNTFQVRQAGDELSLTSAGEPILRTDAAAPQLDEPARLAVRAFLVRRLERAMRAEDGQQRPA